MPEIIKTYNLKNISPSDLYQICIASLQDIGGIEVKQSPQVFEGSCVVPSRWGWGGMKVGFKIYQQSVDIINLDLRGYIAQFGPTPLTKKMDQFLKQVADQVGAKNGQLLNYEPLTRFLPKYTLQLNKKDFIIVVIIIATFFATLPAFSFHWLEHGLTFLVIIGGYYIGRKMLFKNK